MKNFVHIILFCTALSLACGCNQRSGPDLRETYAARDTKAFGGYVARSLLELSFPDNYVQNVKEPFAKTAALFDDTASVYFCASRNLYVDEKDVSAMLDFVYYGNTVFLASANFDSALLNKIYCKVKAEPLFIGNVPGTYMQTSVQLIEEIYEAKDSFGYYYHPFSSYFSEINDNYGRVVGYNAFGKTNCIVLFWGKGKLFLHTDPRAFSNYFLLKEDNYKYMQQLTQLMQEKPQHVFWDDYYNRQNFSRQSSGSKSSLSELFKYPGLARAFWLLLAMLILYILFAGKRRQRIVKVIKPNQNSSVAFTETIARLYLQQHDNKNIAEKMITYFNEFIRNKYFLSGTSGNKDFITALSRKSGVAEENTTALFNAIQAANKSQVIDDYQLLSLNEQIQQFYKTRK